MATAAVKRIAEDEPETAEGAALAVEKPVWPMVVELLKPIQAHGETIEKLSFREPTAADIEACGLPIRFKWNEDGTRSTEIIVSSMFALMSRLAAVPPTSIKQLTPGQWHDIGMRLGFFFMPGMGT